MPDVKPLTEAEECWVRRTLANVAAQRSLGDWETKLVQLLATLDAARASLAAAERERDEARLKANILADGAFHDGKERSRLTDWTTELRGQVSALTVERDALRAEVEAWRRFDDDGCTGTFGITARRLQAMNEGGERG